MAIAKYEKSFVASSNFKDVAKYCKENGIGHLGTMDILYEALMNQILTESECDEFIKIVKASGNKLPADTIEEYTRKYKM